MSNTRTAAKSGHKIGKSNLAATLALWWSLTRWRGRAILTAPAGHQLRNIIWPEIQRLHSQALHPLGGHCSPDPFRGLKLPGDREIICVSTDKPERIAGLSGPNQLFIVDEASGYPEKLWPPILGNLAGGGRLLALGNPTQTSGTYYDAFTTKRRMWSLHTISSAETPNVTAGKVVIPGLATRAWIREMLDDYSGVALPVTSSAQDLRTALLQQGDKSPFLSARVKGDFPSQSSNAVIGLGLVEAAVARWGKLDSEPADWLDLGVDVARFGDDASVVAARRGLVAYGCLAVNGYDTIQVAGLVARALRLLRRPDERVRIKVDVIGYGAGAYDQLRYLNDEDELGEFVEVIPVNVAETSAQPDEYYQLRDEIWFGIRKWLEAGGTFESDGKLESELVAPTYSFARGGRVVKVESKDELKKRLKRSPDHADALGLAIYEGGAQPILAQPVVPDLSRWVNVPGRGF